MSEDRTNREENDFFANNNGIVKSWKGLILAITGILGFVGYIVLLAYLATIPSLQWLVVTLTGLLFFAAGVFFLALSKGSYNLPIFTIMIGTVLMASAISEKFFPGFIDSIGDALAGAVFAVFGLIMLLYPFIVTACIKSRYRVTVDATVIYVERNFSRARKGHHAYTYRTAYEFTYNGKVYEVKDKIFTSGEHPATGEERELRIKSKKPEAFYDLERLKRKSPLSYVFPVILLALGIYLMVA